MYPNKVLVLNENDLAKLNKEEVTFILAHEFAHFYMNHSYIKSEEVARIVVHEGIHIIDVERLVPAAFMLPGMKDVHYKIEDQADIFATNYMKMKGYNINCENLFVKLGSKTESNDTHKITKERCKNFITQ